MSEIREMIEKSPKMRKSLEIFEIAKKRFGRKVALGRLERKTLQNAKNTILRIFEDFADSEIAEKLDISEKSVRTLKSRTWTFRRCLMIAEKRDLDVEVVFGRFHHSREGKKKE